MSGTQILVLLVTIAGLITLRIMWKDWIEASEHKHWQDAALRLSQQETERLEMIIDAVSQQRQIEYLNRQDQK